MILSWKGEIWNEMFCIPKSNLNNTANLIEILEWLLLFSYIRASETFRKLEFWMENTFPVQLFSLQYKADSYLGLCIH